MLSEFKAFIAKGNVMELAVAVIIGGAFSGIVKSLTDEIIMPVVGAIFGNIDFSDRYIVLAGEVEPGTTLAAAREAGANVLGLGAFVSVVINFVILAFIIFMLVRYATKITAQFEKQEEEAAPAPAGPTEIELLTEIRDSLKK
ncbi:large conductance mechanosensitive channel protein MscL [Erythrobacter dokdonensis]|jgi:large conductance mechanosensitive channel|uniref:Large-conductance mechanosensitive channel n=1 Tax=Erythrobacter dokdonensis DSW-74 TaxID=1300349 RepID=A0A1A7BKL7_9SPHN|nr:large conductance mechanosensitive channel protein MscL [Erythrobacter dokdonensis]MEE4316383.1 large conductance mechanosensitive channel protein MscL [Erythrobacter sp.]OBV12027.1 Large-conductance mechanosensitive channel [Erythrobacter dokdonensis DSW-74]